MKSTAGTLPDLLPRWQRNSFPSMEHTMPIAPSQGIDWLTSAISGGFQPRLRGQQFQEQIPDCHRLVLSGTSIVVKYLLKLSGRCCRSAGRTPCSPSVSCFFPECGLDRLPRFIKTLQGKKIVGQICVNNPELVRFK